MKKLTSSQLLNIAARFERFAQLSVLTNGPAYYLWRALRSFLNDDVSEKEFLIWLENNKTILGDKLTTSLGNHWFYYNNEMTLDLPDPDPQQRKPGVPHSEKMAVICKDLQGHWKDNQYKQRDIISSSILQGFGIIPPLKLYVIDSVDLVSGGQLEKEFAHDEFIFTALKKIYYNVDKEEIVDFIQKNKANIDRVRSLFKGKADLLGKGMPTADGMAFAIGKGFVLKIFKDTHSYNKAVEALQRLHKHPELAKTEAALYDVGILGEFRGRNVYYSIMEQMKTIDDFGKNTKDSLTAIALEIVKYLKDFKSQLKPIKNMMDDKSKYSEIKEKVHLIAKKISDRVASSQSNEIWEVETAEIIEKDASVTSINLKDNWLPLFTEEIIMKYLTGRTDLHMGNLGITNQGELRYFDPAYSGWTSKINL